jgi:hypothetical protein
VAAARRAVVAEAHRYLRDTLGITEDELSSLLGVMRSQIDVSLAGILGEADG